MRKTFQYRSGVAVRHFVGAMVVATALAACTSEQSPGAKPNAALASRQLAERYGALPLGFEPNRGQAGTDARYVAHGPGYALSLTSTGAMLGLQASRAGKVTTQSAELMLTFLGANPSPVIVVLDPLPGHSNYFIGNDPKRWRTNVQRYGRVRYEAVYPGIDVVFYGQQQQLEFDFIIAPGADPQRIRLGIKGVSGAGGKATVEVRTGDLIMRTAAGEVVLRRPRIYQEGQHIREIGGDYLILAATAADGPGEEAVYEVGFALASYAPHERLVIDPVLVYSTFLGGSDNEEGYSIAVDAAGSAYVTGGTYSTDFPVLNPAEIRGGNGDVFVSKLTPEGTALVFSTYIGGSQTSELAGQDGGSGIGVDPAGNVYVAGTTGSSDFPTRNAFQPQFGGAKKRFDIERLYQYDAFVLKLNPVGDEILYSSFLGGSKGRHVRDGQNTEWGGDDHATDLAVDGGGNAYVTGTTYAVDFPTENPVQPESGSAEDSYEDPDAFVTKVSPEGGLVYSTYLGGEFVDRANGVAVDGEGNAYVTGQTASYNFPLAGTALAACAVGSSSIFVTKVNAGGSLWLFSTCLGHGSGRAVAIDAAGEAVFVAGATTSANLPVTSHAFQSTLRGFSDAFVARLPASGSFIDFMTYLGGDGYDEADDVAIHGDTPYVTGWTTSPDFPLPADPDATIFPALNPANNAYDAYVAQLNEGGSALLFSTYLGGSDVENFFGSSVAVDPMGSVYVTGHTASADFPTVSAAYPTHQGGRDAFVAKIGEPLPPSPTPSPTHTRTATVTATSSTTPTPTTTLTPTLTPRGSVSGQKFDDRNGNGQKDGDELGLPGWLIFIDANGDGLLNNPVSGNGQCDAVASEVCTATDEAGFYAFNLPPGGYRVREVQQAGWQQTTADPPDVAIEDVGQRIGGLDFGNQPLPTPTATPSRTRRPTSTPGGPPELTGDCNRDQRVAINELILGVNIALGHASVDDCPSFDRNGDGKVTIDELIAAVNAALNGPPGPTSTATVPDFKTPTPSPSPLPSATNTQAPTSPPTPTAGTTPMPQVCRQYFATDVPQGILDFNGAASFISVADAGSISSVAVIGLQGTHSAAGDLVADLESPAGTYIVLFAGMCGGSDDFDLGLVDTAPSALSCPLNRGATERPQQSLAAFNGENAAGVWLLGVWDNKELDEGTLLGWGLEICVAGA